MTRTAMINEQEEERRRLTLEALDDVDAGRVIDHQVVQAWADSLSDETRMHAAAI
jgi:predicted transcriptional regulator